MTAQQWVQEHYTRLVTMRKPERWAYIRQHRPEDDKHCNALFINILVQEGERTA